MRSLLPVLAGCERARQYYTSDRASPRSSFEASSRPASSPSTRREQVIAIQTGLQALGLYHGAQQGIWGNETETAFRELVRRAQQSPEYRQAVQQGHVTFDGLYGPQTQRALEAMAARGEIDANMVRAFHDMRHPSSAHAPTVAALARYPEAPPATHSPVAYMGDSIAQGMFDAASGNKHDFAVPGSGVLVSNRSPVPHDLPPGTLRIVQVGTNDIVGFAHLEGAALDRKIHELAQAAVAYARQGGPAENAVLLGINRAEGAYTGNLAAWSRPGFVDRFNSIVDRVNTAYEQEAARAGIRFQPTDAAITSAMVSSDHLHLNREGARTMAGLGINAMLSQT